MKDLLFEEILSKPDVFYRQQQRDEPDLKYDEKRQILSELLETKPHVFLERYYSLISKDFIDCFPTDPGDRCRPYLDLILSRKEQDNSRWIRNRRFMALQKLKDDGEYFSLESMRQRDPALFDTMIGDHIPDSEKIQMRPTVERRPGSSFSNLMEQFDESQRIAERRKRHFAEWEGCMNDRTDKFMNHVSRRMDLDNEDFEMEFDSDDEEGREAEAKRKRHQNLTRYIVDKELPERVFPESIPLTTDNLIRNIADETTRQLSELRVVEEETHPDDPRTSAEQEQMDSAGMEQGALVDEFRSFMEQRFMNGEDDRFVDYQKIDNDDSSVQFSKWKEQELEDAYFADNESCNES